MVIQITFWLLFFAVFYLLVTSVIFLRNRYDLTSLNFKHQTDILQKISVCIPARNEEASINRLLNSLENQTWPDYEVHILDDQSEDETLKIAETYQKQHPDKFFAHKGKEKPEGWLGKPWACHQLSEKCNGEILLFLDADTELQPAALWGIAASFQKNNIDMLTVWPRQKLVTFWEKTVIPVVFFFLVTHLPAAYVRRDPRWMPDFLKKTFRLKFSAACGQCIALKRDAYRAVGGHSNKLVKNEVLEDVKLARIIKQNRFTLQMFDGTGSVSCRMYQNESEIFEGFRKNFLSGFNHSISFFLLAGLLHLIVYVLPFFTLIFSFFQFDPAIFFLSVASVTLLLMQRLILAIWYQMDPIYSFTHPLGVLWFQRLAAVIIWDHISGKKQYWKGREI